MSRTKQTAGDKQRITKRAQKAFAEWNAQREDQSDIFRQYKRVPYWYVSRDNDVVMSFYDGEPYEITLVPDQETGYKKATSKEWDEETGKRKTIDHYIHRMKAELFPEVYRYGDAKRKPFEKMEVHHMDGVEINDTGSIEVLTKNAHDGFFKGVPAFSSSAKEHEQYMVKIGKIAAEEEPDRITLLFPGTGQVNGEDRADLHHGVYADDAPGFSEIAEQALTELQKPRRTILKQDGYVISYFGNLSVDVLIQKIQFKLFEYIKKLDMQEPMEAETKYPLTLKIKDIQEYTITIEVMKYQEQP